VAYPLAPRGHGRRAVLGSLAVAAAGAPFALSGIGASAGTVAAAQPLKTAPKLVWSPNPLVDGLNAFEGIEDDRAHSDPVVKHIYVKDGVYHWDMPVKERDRERDRQRNEVRGMRTAGKPLIMGLNSTWRFTYDLFIPSTLHGTSQFTHIHQLKKPGTGSLPVVTMSLRRDNGREVLALYASPTASTSRSRRSPRCATTGSASTSPT